MVADGKSNPSQIRSTETLEGLYVLMKNIVVVVIIQDKPSEKRKCFNYSDNFLHGFIFSNSFVFMLLHTYLSVSLAVNVILSPEKPVDVKP